MHPLTDELRKYSENRLDTVTAEKIRRHLDECELCREHVNDYQAYLKAMKTSPGIENSAVAQQLADRLYQDALRGAVIDLAPLIQPGTDRKVLLAADGANRRLDDPEEVATLYSENPDVVLRITHSAAENRDQLQLISDDPALVAGVLLQLPESGAEYLTDDHGRAILADRPVDDYRQAKWQIKMPDAVFSLQPLVYDPEHTEYADETTLESANKDRIRIRFEGKTVGKQISLQILALDGQSDFGRVRIAIIQPAGNELADVGPGDTVTFDLATPDHELKIRIFRR